MFSIDTNQSALNALQSLDMTAQSMQTTQSAISTGKIVGASSDNPAIYSIATNMNAEISGLAAVSSNLNFSQSVLNVAQSAATQISSQLASLKNTILNGVQTGITTATINAQINSALTNINAFAQSATFNGVNIAGGSGTDPTTGGAITTAMTTTQDANGNTITVAQENMTTGSTGLGLTGLNVSASGVDLGGLSSTTAFALNDYVKLGDGTKSTYFVLSDGSAAPTAPVATDSNNSVVFVNFNTTDSQATVLSKLASAMQSNGYGATVATAAVGTGTGSIAAGDLVITGNGVTTTGSSLSLATAGGAALSTVTSTNTAIATVDSAISALNTKVATLGQYQQQITGLQSFTSALSSALTSGVGALTDADMAAESAMLTSLQTKQQLGIQSLSIANQAPQALMTLFR
jgi:flagellin